VTLIGGYHNLGVSLTGSPSCPDREHPKHQDGQREEGYSGAINININCTALTFAATEKKVEPTTAANHQQQNKPGRAGLIALSLLLAAGMPVRRVFEIVNDTNASSRSRSPGAGAQSIAPQPVNRKRRQLSRPEGAALYVQARGRRDPFAPIIGGRKRRKKRSGPPARTICAERVQADRHPVGRVRVQRHAGGAGREGYFIRIGTIMGRTAAWSKRSPRTP